ncbi:hypothetical protein CC78DRAFT_114163 [Lojkania enalia]|uniref:Mid2 domain-containing protein n=1 Tax=Lojkania enalia TaxID=147567 RepID=A0A9P4K2X4_9PLEO|nr:hypothetical protein CC78DRAFT_114163 [Didymosphaeria enalia]
MTLLFLILLFARGILAQDAEAACYGLDGTNLDSTFGPCNPAANHSGCCAIHRPAGSVDICLDNGLCMATNDKYMGTIWQNGCTDPTGRDPACPTNLCPDVRDNFQDGNSVLAWNILMCDFGSYCCRAATDSRNCCNNATAPRITTDFIGAFQFETSTVSGSLTAPTPSGTSSSVEPSVFATAVFTGDPFEYTMTPTSTSPAEAQICPKDKSAMVGGAVGGTLSAVILALLGTMFWLYKREKRQRKLKEHYEEQFGQTWAYRRTMLVESESRVAVSDVDEKVRPDT